MGTLIAMARPVEATPKLADHTYVKCGTGKKAWGCWGGKTNGTNIGQGPGSTKRADKIAGLKERGGITCYMINGVCHQAANRILLPAGVLVTKARGYAVSSALFGPYGRLGRKPCLAPFYQYPDEKGDLAACKQDAMKKTPASKQALTADQKLDWLYIQQALALYAEAPSASKGRFDSPSAQEFQTEIFMHMARFHLGPMLDGKLTRRLKTVRTRIEKQYVSAVGAFSSKRGGNLSSFADDIDMAAFALQNELAHAMTPEQYETLLDLKREEQVVLADRRIVKQLERERRSK